MKLTQKQKNELKKVSLRGKRDKLIAFYGLDYRDELYSYTLSNNKQFKKIFGYNIPDYNHDDFDVYEWISDNCVFVGYLSCVL